VDGLARAHGPLLVVAAPARTHARRHQRGLGSEGCAQRRGLVRRAHEGAHALRPGHAGEPLDAARDAALHADGRKVTPVERCQHRDRDDLKACALLRGSLGRATEHGGTAARVDGEHARTQARRAADRPIDGLGDVVQLQIEEHGPARLGHEADGGRPRLDEQLEPHLEHAHGVVNRVRHRARLVERGEIEREDEA
jgi:hypothetical protein